MQGKEILIIIAIISSILTAIGVLFWKQIGIFFFPEKFYRVQINKKSGTIIAFDYYYGKDSEVIKYEENEYYAVKSDRLWKRLKFYEYDEGNPVMIEKKPDTERNLRLELKRKEINYRKLFEEKKSPLELLMNMLIPAVIGAIIGAAVIFFQYKECIAGA